MHYSIITLTTDFGVSSIYVAEMKAAILSIHADARIVDLTHAIPPQDVWSGAFALRQAATGFPPGSIHVAVVDPGVGGARKILLAKIGASHYVAPDNGLLTFVLEGRSDAEVREVDAPRFWRETVSRTFHGRDVMGPVAAHLARGIASAELATGVTRPSVLLDAPKPRLDGNTIEGQVIYVDSFGNLITNMEDQHLAGMDRKATRIAIGDLQLALLETYAEAARGEALGLIGSSGRLEIAVANGSAARRLNLGAGTPVRVSQ